MCSYGRRLCKTQHQITEASSASATKLKHEGVRNLNVKRKKYLFRSLYTTQRTPIGVLFALAGALVASRLDMRAKLRRIRFAFAARRSNIFCRAGVYSRRFVFHRLFSAGASPRPTIKHRACESRSEAELP